MRHRHVHQKYPSNRIHIEITIASRVSRTNHLPNSIVFDKPPGNAIV